MRNWLFKVEEVLFLLAEADLRGWNVGGTAEDFYNAGIKEFFTKHAFSDASYNEYMSWKGMGNLGVSPQIKEEAIYKDFLDSDNNLPLWGGYYMLNNSYDKPENADTNPYINDSKEQKLQKIITQKWLLYSRFPQLPGQTIAVLVIQYFCHTVHLPMEIQMVHWKSRVLTGKPVKCLPQE